MLSSTGAKGGWMTRRLRRDPKGLRKREVDRTAPSPPEFSAHNRGRRRPSLASDTCASRLNKLSPAGRRSDSGKRGSAALAPLPPRLAPKRGRPIQRPVGGSIRANLGSVTRFLRRRQVRPALGQIGIRGAAVVSAGISNLR